MKTEKMMSAIIVLDSDTNGDLDLSDNGRSYPEKNEVVTWIIHPDSGVECITEISAKPGSPNVFINGDPHVIGNSKNWQGRIKNDFNEDSEKKHIKKKFGKQYIVEEYNIVWKDGKGEHTFDPQLEINI